MRNQSFNIYFGIWNKILDIIKIYYIYDAIIKLILFLDFLQFKLALIKAIINNENVSLTKYISLYIILCNLYMHQHN